MKKIGIVTGLQREAGCLRLDNVTCAGADTDRAYRLARGLAENGCTALVSFGIAGGLNPDYEVGAIIVGNMVLGESGESFETDLTSQNNLTNMLPNAYLTSTLSTSRIVHKKSDKANLCEKFGASAVDMESLAVGKVADELGLPFAILRVIADTADQNIPKAALNAVDQDGYTQIRPVLTGLIRKPWEIFELVRLGRNSNKAFRELRRIALLAGPNFGF